MRKLLKVWKKKISRIPGEIFKAISEEISGGVERLIFGTPGNHDRNIERNV